MKLSPVFQHISLLLLSLNFKPNLSTIPESTSILTTSWMTGCQSSNSLWLLYLVTLSSSLFLPTYFFGSFPNISQSELCTDTSMTSLLVFHPCSLKGCLQSRRKIITRRSSPKGWRPPLLKNLHFMCNGFLAEALLNTVTTRCIY